jgi:phage tail-like protein
MSSQADDFKGIFPVAARFLFEVDGVQIGTFNKIEGLELHVGVDEFREGGENGYVHKFPGRMTWPHVILRAGITNSDALFQWVNKSSGDAFASNKNTLTRSTGAITSIASDGSRLRAWELQGAFAVRWTGPRFDATSGAALDEELEIAHHGFTSKTFSGN